MSCYHPSFIQKSINRLTGEVTTKFLGGLNNVLECNDVLRSTYNGEKTLDFIPRTFQDGFYHDFIQIPCGKCIGCRMDYSRSWADRMTYHAIGKEECSYFFTLTYDDIHQDENDYIKLYDLYSLNYDHVTDFIKRLRNKFRDFPGIDYYYSGEYGDSSFRNHFHMIVYNLVIPDLQFYKSNDNGDPLYSSAIIDSLWQKGFCVIAKYNWHSAAYTARYVEKKRDGRAMVEYTALGLEPEKCRCSRRPGIAYDYYMDNYRDIWLNNGLSVPRSVNSCGHLGIPRYFRKLAENKCGFDEFNDWRKRSLEHMNIVTPLKLDNSSFDIDRVRDMLSFEEREMLRHSKKRNF